MREEIEVNKKRSSGETKRRAGNCEVFLANIVSAHTNAYYKHTTQHTSGDSPKFNGTVGPSPFIGGMKAVPVVC